MTTYSVKKRRKWAYWFLVPDMNMVRWALIFLTESTLELQSDSDVCLDSVVQNQCSSGETGPCPHRRSPLVLSLNDLT